MNMLLHSPVFEFADYVVNCPCLQFMLLATLAAVRVIHELNDFF